MKKALQTKVEKAEFEKLKAAVESGEVLEGEARLAKKQMFFCLSCDRPVKVTTSLAKATAVPTLPPALPSTNTRGAYDVEHYRKERKRRYL